MQTLKGKTAFITGAAEGIGFHIARSFAANGMQVMLSDIDAVMLDKAVASLKSEGFKVAGYVCDTTQKSQLIEAAQATIDTFGKVNVLVNNAGVSAGGPQDKISDENWRWVIEVNLMGVVYGTQVFAPLIQAANEEGHIVNVASMAGMGGIGMVGPYCATKAAVVSLSESWYGEYKASNIGVSVLCPSFVKSRIHASPRNRQEQFGGPIDIETLEQRPAYIKSKALVEGGIDTAIVGERVVEAIINNELYVFTHPHYRQVIDDRYTHLSKAFDKADASPALESVEREEIAKF